MSLIRYFVCCHISYGLKEPGGRDELFLLSAVIGGLKIEAILLGRYLCIYMVNDVEIATSDLLHILMCC